MTLLRKESENEKLCLLWYSVVVRPKEIPAPGPITELLRLWFSCKHVKPKVIMWEGMFVVTEVKC